MGTVMRSLALTLLLCLVAGQAWGAGPYYVDCTNGTGGGAGTSGDPLLTITAAFALAVDGDTIYVKAGTTCNEQVTIIGTDSLAIKNWPTDSDVDPTTSATPTSGKYTIDAQNTRDYGIFISTTGTADNVDTDGITIEDAEIKNAKINAIGVQVTGSSAAGATYAITRNIGHDVGPAITIATEADYANGTCFWARTLTNGSASLNGITYTKNLAYNCAKHGFAARQNVLNAVYDHNIAHDCGLTASGQGFTANPMYSTYTSGWTLASGTIYYRDRLAAADVEQRMADYTASMLLTRNGATTTPASGEWSITAAGGAGACTNSATLGCIYVNTGGVANSKTLIVKRYANGPFTYRGNEAYNINDFPGGEGHGFDQDDLSGPALYSGNYAHNNDGSGFTTLKGESVSWHGNISTDNAGAGFNFNACSGCELTNNAAARNSRGFYDAGITSENVDLTNNAALANTPQGFTISAGTAAASGSSSATNASYGNTTNTCANTTCSITSDFGLVGGTSPATAAGFCLNSDSALIGAGTWIGAYILDYNGHGFANPPNIGAMSACRGRAPAAARAVAGARATQ